MKAHPALFEGEGQGAKKIEEHFPEASARGVFVRRFRHDEFSSGGRFRPEEFLSAGDFDLGSLLCSLLLTNCKGSNSVRLLNLNVGSDLILDATVASLRVILS